MKNEMHPFENMENGELRKILLVEKTSKVQKTQAAEELIRRGTDNFHLNLIIKYAAEEQQAKALEELFRRSGPDDLEDIFFDIPEKLRSQVADKLYGLSKEVGLTNGQLGLVMWFASSEDTKAKAAEKILANNPKLNELIDIIFANVPKKQRAKVCERVLKMDLSTDPDKVELRDALEPRLNYGHLRHIPNEEKRVILTLTHRFWVSSPKVREIIESFHLPDWGVWDVFGDVRQAFHTEEGIFFFAPLWWDVIDYTGTTALLSVGRVRVLLLYDQNQGRGYAVQVPYQIGIGEDRLEIKTALQAIAWHHRQDPRTFQGFTKEV